MNYLRKSGLLFLMAHIFAVSLIVAADIETPASQNADAQGSQNSEVVSKEIDSKAASKECLPITPGVNSFEGRIKGVRVYDRAYQSPTAVLKITFGAPDLTDPDVAVPYASVALNFSGTARDRVATDPAPFDFYYNNPNIFMTSVLSYCNNAPGYLNYVQEEQGDVSISAAHFDNNYCQFIWSTVYYDVNDKNVLYLALYYWSDSGAPSTAILQGTVLYHIEGRNINSVECLSAEVDSINADLNEANYICCINC